MKLLKLLLSHSRTTLVLTILAGALSGSASAGLLGLINTAINRSKPWNDSRLLWAFVGLCLIAPTSRILSAFLLMLLGQGAVHRLRMKLSGAILALPLQQLESLGSHRLLVVLTDDLNAITDALVNVPVLCMNTFVVAGCLAYLGWLSPLLLLIFVFLLIAGALSYQLPLMWSVRRLRLAREEEDSLYRHFRGLTEGNKELKLHRGRQHAFLAGLESSSWKLRGLNLSAAVTLSIASSWGQTLFIAVVGMLIFAVPRFATTPQPTLVGYVLLVLYMITPLQVILNSLPSLGRANVAIAKIENLGLSPYLFPGASPRELSFSPAWRSLELVGVTHSYPDEKGGGRFRMGPISLSLRAGELVFLIGGNGSGKTTLAKILVGLYTPEAGEIRVDGAVLGPAEQEPHRERFAAVFSDFFLFESLLGLDLAGLDERAHDFLVQLQLDRKLEVKNGNFSTINLSQGQRKRLALLTAYLEDREIYVFDEWAADQDPFFKEVFYYQLLPELKARGKTVIVISHDDRYFAVADRLLKMDSGQIEFDRQLDPARRTAV
jgi:putative ATP-binding cassette transporter